MQAHAAPSQAHDGHDAHDAHGHGHDRGGRSLAVGLAVLALLLAVTAGRSVPKPPRPAGSSLGVGSLVLDTGEVLSGDIYEEGDVLRVVGERDAHLVARRRVSQLRWGPAPASSARATTPGVVVLHSGQVLVGPVVVEEDRITVQGVAVPREQVRYLSTAGTRLGPDYWERFGGLEIDPRYAQPAPQASPSRQAPSLSPQEQIASDFQLQAKWEEGFRAWVAVYAETRDPAHRQNLIHCARRYTRKAFEAYHAVEWADDLLQTLGPFRKDDPSFDNLIADACYDMGKWAARNWAGREARALYERLAALGPAYGVMATDLLQDVVAVEEGRPARREHGDDHDHQR